MSILSNIKKLHFIHPLLFAAFPVLALYAVNAEEVAPNEIVIPLVATLGFALGLLLSFLLLTALVIKIRTQKKKKQQVRIWNLRKAAILSTLFVALFFSYGHVLIRTGGWDTMHRTFSPTGGWAALSMIWVAIFVAGAVFIIRAQREFDKTTSILNVIAGVLIIVAAINIVVTESSATDFDIERAGVSTTGESTTELTGPLPDIYYIVPDRYGSASTLTDVYGFDNSEFLDYLSGKGFYIASNSVSNYPFTDESLISSLNMNYLHKEAAVDQVSGNIRDYEVWRFLKSLGYEFIHFGSWYEPTRENEFADKNINYYAMPEFSWFFFQTTWAYPICVELDIVDEWWEAQYKRVLYKFDKLAEIPDIEGPTFVFAHMLVPHPPFVFDSQGDFKTAQQQYDTDLSSQYLEQLIATNNMFEVLIDSLLADSEEPPIIIIQADEGPRPDAMRNDPSWNIGKASDGELQEKMRIFNAYYLPGIDQDVLYRSISPVNSFRLIFNQYFNTEFERLPDRNFIRPPGSNFVEVTDRVGYDQ